MILENEINNEIKSKENNFFTKVLGKTINMAIDMGLKTILPDLIEEQVIDIKDSLLKNGLQEGINTAINSVVDLGKSTKGIFTGNFENMQQMQMAIGNGGIIDSISSLIDKASDRAYELGYLNKTVNTVISKGKDVLLNNISNNIKNELNEQINSKIKIEKHIENWKEYYNNKNFEGMELEYNKIKEQQDKVMPLEKLIKETKMIESMHTLISNNGHKFDLSELEKQLIDNFNK